MRNKTASALRLAKRYAEGGEVEEYAERSPTRITVRPQPKEEPLSDMGPMPYYPDSDEYMPRKREIDPEEMAALPGIRKRQQLPLEPLHRYLASTDEDAPVIANKRGYDPGSLPQQKLPLEPIHSHIAKDWKDSFDPFVKDEQGVYEADKPFPHDGSQGKVPQITQDPRVWGPLAAADIATSLPPMGGLGKAGLKAAAGLLPKIAKPAAKPAKESAETLLGLAQEARAIEESMPRPRQIPIPEGAVFKTDDGWWLDKNGQNLAPIERAPEPSKPKVEPAPDDWWQHDDRLENNVGMGAPEAFSRPKPTDAELDEAIARIERENDKARDMENLSRLESSYTKKELTAALTEIQESIDGTRATEQLSPLARRLLPPNRVKSHRAKELPEGPLDDWDLREKYANAASDLIQNVGGDPKIIAQELSSMRNRDPILADYYLQGLHEVDAPIGEKVGLILNKEGINPGSFDDAFFNPRDAEIARVRDLDTEGPPFHAPVGDVRASDETIKKWGRYVEELNLSNPRDIGQEVTGILSKTILPHYNGSIKEFADHFFDGHFTPDRFHIQGWKDARAGTETLVIGGGLANLPSGFQGSVKRKIVKTPTGGHVYHSFLELPKADQSSGIAKSLLANQVELYKKLGLDYIGLTANIDVGSYAWANYGALPSTDATWKHLAGESLTYRLKSYERNNSIDQKTLADLKELLARPDRLAMWDFVDYPGLTPFNGREGKPWKWAKELIFDKAWDAKIDLKDAATMQRFEEYVSRKKK